MCARSSHSWTVCHETEESITPFSQVEFWEAPPLYHCDYKTTERKQPRYVIKSLFQRNKSGKGSPLFLDCQWISACLHSRITWEAFKNERYRYLIFRNSNLFISATVWVSEYPEGLKLIFTCSQGEEYCLPWWRKWHLKVPSTHVR